MVVVQDLIVIQLKLGDPGGLLIVEFRLFCQLTLDLSKTRALRAVDAVAHLALKMLQSPAQSCDTGLILLFHLVSDRLISEGNINIRNVRCQTSIPQHSHVSALILTLKAK